MLDMDPAVTGAVEISAWAAAQLLWRRHEEPQEIVVREECILRSSISEYSPPIFKGLDLAGETCLVAGGGGGLGQEVVKFLLDHGAAVTAIGRTGSTELRFSLPHQAEYAQVDISQPDQLEQVIKRVAPSQVFQLAGVLKDAGLKDLTWKKFEDVLKPKVYGAHYLHSFSPSARGFVLFSSMASILPFQGQINHAAANAFSDALAHERRQSGLEGVAINWGLWMEVGAAAAAGALEMGRKQGMRAMSNQEAGMRCLQWWRCFLKSSCC